MKITLAIWEEWPSNRRTIFPVNIPHATYIHTCCSYFKPLDHSLKPQDTRINNMTICPNKATSRVPLQQPYHILRLSPACSATSRYFSLPPHYNYHILMMNVSLDTANIYAINISTPDFRICQHFNSNWITPYLQKLTNVAEVPVTQLYKHMFNTSEPTHPDTYTETIGTIFAVCIGVYCF